jgi:hypothetical protein
MVVYHTIVDLNSKLFWICSVRRRRVSLGHKESNDQTKVSAKSFVVIRFNSVSGTLSRWYLAGGSGQILIKLNSRKAYTNESNDFNIVSFWDEFTVHSI